MLHVGIGLGIALQIATLFVPGLRSLLGLTRLGALQMVVLSAAIVTTWAFAELMGHVLGPGKPGKEGPASSLGRSQTHDG